VRLGAKLGPVVVSVFVNPTQFGPSEDFEAYPRDLEADLAKLGDLHLPVAVYAPEVSELYDADASTWVDVADLSEALCGRHREGHFRGVTTVVAKLFGLLRPDVAVFGQKDAQQCLVIQRMVRDLRMPVRMLFGPTVREADGLAMSSRNRYLSPDDRERALSLHRALQAGTERLRAGERETDAIERAMCDKLGGLSVDYAEARSLPALLHPESLRGRVLLAVAGRLEKARLIDNVCLDVEGEVREAPLSDAATLERVRAELRDLKEDE